MSDTGDAAHEYAKAKQEDYKDTGLNPFVLCFDAFIAGVMYQRGLNEEFKATLLRHYACYGYEKSHYVTEILSQFFKGFDFDKVASGYGDNAEYKEILNNPHLRELAEEFKKRHNKENEQC